MGIGGQVQEEQQVFNFSYLFIKKIFKYYEGWKWTLVIATGVLIGIMGYLVQLITALLLDVKLNIATAFIDSRNWRDAFFSFVFMGIFYSFIAGVLCWMEPAGNCE